MSGQETWSVEEAREYFATGRKPVRNSGGDRRVTTGHCHRLIPVRSDGLKFDSKTEERFYNWLCEQGGHIDIHPVLTLAGGIRYRPDFMVWKGGEIVVYDVKGSRKLAHGTEMQRIVKLVKLHPVGRLVLVWWDRKEGAWKMEG